MSITEKKKGDKRVPILLQSAVRRWFKYVIVCILGLVIVCRILLSSSSSSSLRRTITTKTKTNVALRPLELRPDASKWNVMTRSEMSEYLNCDDYYTKNDTPIHDPDTWIGMREAYISIVGTERATVEQHQEHTVANTDADTDTDNDTKTTNTFFETAFRVPFEVRQSPGMGRGIFAKGDVTKGDILYDFSQSAQFWKGSEFVEFLRILQPELACDVLMWSYVIDFGEGVNNNSSEEKHYLEAKKRAADLRIITDLDPGSFCNDGSWSEGNMAWLNSKGEIAEGSDDNPKPASIVRTNGSIRQDTVKSAPLVALRDIKAGEELLCIYSQFSEGLALMVD